jgi:predicted enzyme related to lactoylglutathione lyase
MRTVKTLGIDNVFLQVGDLDEALAFYSDRLGLPVHRRFDAMGMALLRVGDEAPGLGVGAVENPRPGGGKIWLEVDDARAAAEELATRGIEPMAPPFLIPTGWVVELRDPWGNVIGFTDYTARPDMGRSSAGPEGSCPHGDQQS